MSPHRGGSNEYPQSMFWAEAWKISEFFLSEIFQFLEVEFSIYLNRCVFIMWWVTSSFPQLWMSFYIRFSIMSPDFIPSDDTIQKFVFIMVKMPPIIFCYGHLDTFWFSVSCFGTHPALTLLIPSCLCKIWCTDALSMLNWLATFCNVTLRSWLTETSIFAIL